MPLEALQSRATWSPLTVKPAGSQIKKPLHILRSLLSDSPLTARLHFLSGSPPPPLTPTSSDTTHPVASSSSSSGCIVGSDREPAELSASWCWSVFSTSHRIVPFQRIYRRYYPLIQSVGGDTEPRGRAVKGHWSTAQGEGGQGGGRREEGGTHTPNTFICTDLEPCVPV